MASRLSSRQRECLAWAARGKSCWATGIILGLSEHTVACYRKQAMAHYGVLTIIEAVVAAINAGDLTIDDRPTDRDSTGPTETADAGRTATAR